MTTVKEAGLATIHMKLEVIIIPVPDADRNSWLLQEITSRLPGRIDSGVTSFGSVTDLVGALRRAEAAHGEHEKRTGVRDANWADWYAAYMAAEQTGAELPT